MRGYQHFNIWLRRIISYCCYGCIKSCGNNYSNVFHKIHIDPAVASGPLITTVNDLVAVVTYYGLAMIFLVEIFHV